MDYSKSKIYTIICNSTGLMYVGSTCQDLDHRITLHRRLYYCYTKGKANKCSSFDIICNGDYTVSSYPYPCNNKTELLCEELRYQNLIRATGKLVNKNKPGNFLRYECKNDYYKDYHNDHKEQRKLYYITNKDKARSYYEANKEKIKAYSRARYHNLKICV